MAGCEIHSVIVGIADKFIRGNNSSGVVAIKRNEVSEYDIQRVIASAQTISVPQNRKIIHIIPQEYVVDNQDEITQPLNMTGSRLEVKTHIVTASTSSIQNMVNACERAGLQVKDIVLQSLASAESVLMQNERDLGVVVLDIGSGKTDISVFANGTIWHTTGILLAGDYLTSELSIGLKILVAEAERIKCQYGCCIESAVDKKEKIEIALTGSNSRRDILVSEVANILQPRTLELLEMIATLLQRYPYKNELIAGVVITGGTSLLPGIAELAEHVFEMPVRIGTPINIKGLTEMVDNSIFSTGVGLVKYAYNKEQEMTLLSSSINRVPRLKEPIETIKKYLNRFF
jgi:cell division protein FtsA